MCGGTTHGAGLRPIKGEKGLTERLVKNSGLVFARQREKEREKERGRGRWRWGIG
jgi:hypothetical protein